MYKFPYLILTNFPLCCTHRLKIQFSHYRHLCRRLVGSPQSIDRKLLVDLMRFERTTSSLQGTLSPVEIQTQINGWYSNPYFRATIHYTFGFAYHVAPLRTTECFSITFNAFYRRVSRAGTLSLMVRVRRVELLMLTHLGLNQAPMPIRAYPHTRALLFMY